VKDYADILELRRQALELSRLIQRGCSPDAALDALEMPDSG
jgi:hypothetical protein